MIECFPGTTGSGPAGPHPWRWWNHAPWVHHEDLEKPAGWLVWRWRLSVCGHTPHRLRETLPSYVTDDTKQGNRLSGDWCRRWHVQCWKYLLCRGFLTYTKCTYFSSSLSLSEKAKCLSNYSEVHEDDLVHDDDLFRLAKVWCSGNFLSTCSHERKGYYAFCFSF